MHFVFAALLAVTQPWLLVSDLHVNPFDRSTAPAFYGSDTNWPLFESALAQMKKAAPAPPVVIIAGDFLVHEFDRNVRSYDRGQTTTAAALQTMSRVEGAFARAFPHAQFLITMGNNDDPCGDYRTAPGTPYLAQLSRIWAPLVNRNGAATHFERDFSRSGSYTANLPSGLHAIVLDDVPWSFFFQPCNRAAFGMPGAELSWLTQQLNDIPKQQRAVVFMHIPPGIDPSATIAAHRFFVVPFWRGGTLDRFARLFSARRDRIAFAVAGHMHRMDFRVLGGVPILIAPSISPVYSNNPAFLTLQIAADGTLRDYQMYAYDLFEDAWSFAFDFDKTYGAGDFTAQALTAAHERIGRDSTLRYTWMDAVVADSPRHLLYSSWRAFWCAQTEYGDAYAACAGDQRRVTLLRVAVVLVGLAIVLALGLAVLRLAKQRSRA